MDDPTTGAVQPKSPLAMGQRGVQVRSLEELYRFARAACETDFMPKEFRNSPEKAMVAMEFALELGLPLLAGLRSIAVINGRPAIYGDLMLGMVRASGLLEAFAEDLEGTPGSDGYRAVCVTKRVGMEPCVRAFSVGDAKRAKLWGKSGPWTEYPERMLQMRARSFNLRDNFGDVLMGLVAAEEAMDIPTEPMPVGPQALTMNTSALPAKVIPPDEVHPTLEQVSSLMDLAKSVGVYAAAFGEQMRRLMDLPPDAKISKKFLREQMTLRQYEAAWTEYQAQLKAQVESILDEDDVPLHDAPNAPVEETSPTANTIEAAAEQNDSTGQPGVIHGKSIFASAEQIQELTAYADAHGLGRSLMESLAHYPKGVPLARFEEMRANLEDRVEQGPDS